MARKLVTVEISVAGCSLPKTLNGGKKKSVHLVQSFLVWPRAGIALRKSAVKAELNSGEYDAGGASWSQRIVFKESVESTFGVAVGVTEALGSETLEEFLRFMTGTVLKLGADVIEGSAIPAADLAAAPFDYLSGKVKKVPEPGLIAAGTVDVHTDSIPAKGEKLIKVVLTSPREVVKRSRRTINKKTKVTRKVLMKKGEPNGEITLSIKRI